MRKIFTLVTVLWALGSFAQQLPIDNQYVINKYSLSPAYGGFNENAECFVGNRQSWLGITGAPEKKFLNINGPIGTSSGVGALFTYETTGSFSHFYGNLAYAYKMNFNKDLSLSLGFGGEFYKNQIEVSKLKTQGPDPLVMAGEVAEGSTFNASFGMLIKYKGLNLSVGLPRILSNKLVFGDSLNYTLAREYTAHASYFYEVNKKFEFEPFVVVRKTVLSPLMYEGALMLKYNKRVWIAPMYRSTGTIGLNFGVALGSRLVLNYTYETGGKTGLAGMSSGTHEISFGFLMKRTKNTEANPTIFPPDESLVPDMTPFTAQIRKLQAKMKTDSLAMLKKFNDLLKNAEVKVDPKKTPEDNNDWTPPSVMNDVKFANGSDQLFASSFPILNKLASDMVKRPKLQILITGHTDNVGSPAYNKQLSMKRAEQIKKYLVEKRGIDASRITCKGMGSEVPIADTESDEGRAKNRRIDVRFKNGK